MRGLQALGLALVLMAVPVIAASMRGRPRPQALSRLALVSTLCGSVLVLATLTICAGAAVEETLTASSRDGSGPTLKHLIPNVPVTGWASLLIVVSAVVMAGRSLVTTTSRRRALGRHLTFAEIDVIDDVPVATVPTEDFVVAVVPGRRRCVVLSEGARSRLSEDEMRAVLRHEEAHLRLGHHRHLLVARTLERSLWFVPGILRATGTLRRSLECAADASARKNGAVGDLASAIELAHGGTEAPPYRRLALTDTPASPLSLTGYWVLFAIVGVLAVSLAASWLGLGG